MSVSKNSKTGTWEVRVYFKDWTGERKQTTKRGFAKKSDAQDWERAFKLQKEQRLDMNFETLSLSTKVCKFFISPCF